MPDVLLIHPQPNAFAGIVDVHGAIAKGRLSGAGTLIHTDLH
jgi:hypothetical protein